MFLKLTVSRSNVTCANFKSSACRELLQKKKKYLVVWLEGSEGIMGFVLEFRTVAWLENLLELIKWNLLNFIFERREK